MNCVQFSSRSSGTVAARPDGYSDQSCQEFPGKTRHDSCTRLGAMDNCAKTCAIAFVFLMFGCDETKKEQDGAGGASSSAGGASSSAGGASNSAAGASNSAAGAINSAAGASSGAAGASSGAAGAQCTDGSPLPMQIPARQRVTFNLRNSSSETRFIVQAGASCNTFGIQGRTGTDETALVLGVSSISCNGQCGRCGCDAPAPSASEILAIEPGGTHS